MPTWPKGFQLTKIIVKVDKEYQRSLHGSRTPCRLFKFRFAVNVEDHSVVLFSGAQALVGPPETRCTRIIAIRFSSRRWRCKGGWCPARKHTFSCSQDLHSVTAQKTVHWRGDDGAFSWRKLWSLHLVTKGFCFRIFFLGYVAQCYTVLYPSFQALSTWQAVMIPHFIRHISLVDYTWTWDIYEGS